MQLQVFSAPEDGAWERVRGRLMAKIASQGGEVRESTGQLGTGLRGTVPGGEGGRVLVTVRFVGCDGPGWMLRGVMTGSGAGSDVVPEQMRQVFLGTVVDIHAATPLPHGLVMLRWPPPGGWNEADKLFSD
ncbi:DUF3710 domain-containing protein [Streptomyces sp. NPDC101225]|uniref:DUF3710 domain-containing protein n=1 Tax=Streptomyces sp. NPDC101225 TaxID=3366135 RepID=UPI0038051435